MTGLARAIVRRNIRDEGRLCCQLTGSQRFRFTAIGLTDYPHDLRAA